MRQRTRSAFFVVSAAMFLTFLVALSTTTGWSQPDKPESSDSTIAAEPAPPPNQTYIGLKKCSSCHFDQYLVWRKDKHSKAFDILPTKYKKDASCLKCHTTGYGKKTGYQSISDKHLAGISCETCHGPGNKHEEACKPFARVKKLDKGQEKLARDSIYRILPQNICISCHTVKGHKPHPKYDKE